MICYLASIHFPLQETRTDHPLCYGAAVHRGAGTCRPVYQRDIGLLK